MAMQTCSSRTGSSCGRSIAAHRGVEVDTQGDAFFVAFTRASDAATAAADIQQALLRGPVSIRIGLHTGEPTVTDEGYVGIDVHRARAHHERGSRRPDRALGANAIVAGWHSARSRSR